MTFALKLKASDISNPNSLAIAQVEAAMLWPESFILRHKWFRARFVEYLRSHTDSIPLEVLQRMVGSDQWWGAPETDGLSLPVEMTRYDGFAAGAIVYGLINSCLSGKRTTVANLQSLISPSLKKVRRIEPRTMNNKSGPTHRFRPVAHLWAAYVKLQSWRDNSIFPVEPSSLVQFLGTAEAIRRFAEKTTLPRSRLTIMRPGEAVMLPKEVEACLPKYSIEHDLSRGQLRTSERTRR